MNDLLRSGSHIWQFNKSPFVVPTSCIVLLSGVFQVLVSRGVFSHLFIIASVKYKRSMCNGTQCYLHC